MGRASRPSFLFHGPTGETPIPLFGNPPKFLRTDHGYTWRMGKANAKTAPWGELALAQSRPP